MSLQVGDNQVIDIDTQRAAIEKPQGRIDLYTLKQISESDWTALHIGSCDTWSEAERWAKGKGPLPSDHPAPVILRR